MIDTLEIGNPQTDKPFSGIGNNEHQKEKAIVRKCFFFKVSKKTADILKIIRIRILLTIAIAYLIALFTCASQLLVFLYGIIPILVIWAETIYICVWHDAKDFYW